MSDHSARPAGSIPPVHAAAPHRPASDPRRWWALVLLCLAQFMVILDITVVNVALPTIGSDLQLDRTSLAWVVTTYTLCFGGLLLLGGQLADTLGRRRMATYFLASLYLQRLLGYSALDTGLVFVPAALATIAGRHVAAQAVGHLGPRPVAVVGFILASGGTLLLGHLPADASVLVELLPGLLLATAGLGAGFVVATTTAMAHVDQAQAGVTSGLLSTGHELGASLGWRWSPRSPPPASPATPWPAGLRSGGSTGRSWPARWSPRWPPLPPRGCCRRAAPPPPTGPFHPLTSNPPAVHGEEQS